ncbi:sigma-54-dependent transcriptional regulator [Aquimonas sp.]|jgi:NtrC-family two-component system response regulator AlgB|uniref:sigma-54-dependent transcriptional regulator n=1 Tax=Aquimonas sp. TaxID=1872588 RepID=UPI0037C17B8C
MSKPDEPSARILAIDDDRALLDTYAAIIESQGMRLTPATTLAEGLRLAATRPFDVCLLDRNIGYDLGTDALPELKSQAPSLRIIMATAHRDTDAALEALRLGVDDYLVKPFSPEQLRIALARQIEARRLARKVDVLEREAGQRNPRELASEAPAMQQALALARQVARTSANVLLLGESGTGKNVFARAIHGWSPRAEHGFVPVNCPSLSAELLENELFGHRKGAYTGAQESSEGRVAQAEGGTLFLDEIGDFPLALQPKLLRFIQDKEYERVGDPQSRQANVRLVTATHRDLPTMSEVGEFRLDLYYRLNVVAITLPPLRERREDVLALAQSFLARYGAEYGCPARRFEPAAERALVDYHWPGNVRELQNVIERAVILCPQAQIPASLLSLQTGTGAGVAASAAALQIGADITLEALERRHVEAVLARASTLDEAARSLGIDSSTLYRKRKTYGLD